VRSGSDDLSPPLAGVVELPPGRSYLDTAAEGLPVATAEAALLRSLDAKRRGSRGRDALYAAEAACREEVATWLAASVDEVALVPDTSTGIARWIDAQTWRPGDEVLINDLEFPSNVTPWLVARERYGITVRTLPTRGGVLQPDDVAGAIHDRTRVVAVSLVSFKSGGRVDVARLGNVTRAAGAVLAVDATQGFGAVPLPSDGWDVMWSSGYKWLLGVHGIAIMAVRRELLEGSPAGAPGWRSSASTFLPDRFERLSWADDARRFHAGMPAFGPMMVLHEGMSALRRAGAGAIESHLEQLGREFLSGLARLGIEPLTPSSPDRRAGIVAFETDDPVALRTALGEHGIDVWGNDGRLRISFHAYTPRAHLRHCLDVLEGLHDAGALTTGRTHA
jgi:cysteine desulfurase / selenocysteine lyase